MKELPSAWTQEGKDVLEVWSGTCGATERRRIEETSPRSEKEEGRESATDLDTCGVKVLVRQAIARQVKQRPDDERRDARAARRPGGSAGCDMERDDHGPR